MADLKNVIYLSKNDYNTLIATGTVTIGGVTLTYDPDNLYLIPDKTISLESSTTAGGIQYLEDVTYTGASAGGSDTFLKSINGGSGSFTPATRYLHSNTSTALTGVRASGTATALTGVKASNTAKAGSETHTHNYDKTTGVTLTANAATATGRITYIQDMSGGSGSLTGTRSTSGTGLSSRRTLIISHTHNAASGTTKYLSASPSHTHTISSAPSATTTFVTSVAADGTATVLTGVEADGTANFVTKLVASTVQATGDITYMESATHTHTAASNGSTGSAVTSVSGGNITKQTKYLDLIEED